MSICCTKFFLQILIEHILVTFLEISCLMRKIFGYLRNYFLEVDKRNFVLSCLFVAIAIFINYYHGLNKRISILPIGQQYLSWYAIFLTSFSFAYIGLALCTQASVFRHRKFVILLLLAPAVFAWKMSFKFSINLSPETLLNAYWNQVIYWPVKMLVVTLVLLVFWKLFSNTESFYGLSAQNFSAKPYGFMLILMIPLVAAASTQPDFLAVYPKLQNIAFLANKQDSGWYKLWFELSYGSDFIGIELFFRGFLVLAFAKWAGKDAILPMALFYCTIHFGKPLGECISSFFGGLILGVVTYHTRTIYGGLIVHLGIAWLMELGGYLGRTM